MRGATKPHHTSQVDTVGLYLAQSPHRGTKRFQYLWWPGTLVAAVSGGRLLCETTVTKMEWASSWLFIAPLPQVLYLLRGLCTCCLSGGTVQYSTAVVYLAVINALKDLRCLLVFHLERTGPSHGERISSGCTHQRLETGANWHLGQQPQDQRLPAGHFYARYTCFKSKELERFLGILNWLNSSFDLFCKINEIRLCSAAH